MKDFLLQSGYKRDKNIYTPPILQLGEFNAIHWLEDVLPEIIWIGILQKHYGLGLGSKIALQVSESTSKLPGRTNTWLAPISYFKSLGEEEKSILTKEMQGLDYLSKLNTAFAEITFLYPEFPFSFFVNDTRSIQKAEAIKSFKSFLAGLYNRTNFDATFMQATAVDMAFQAGIFTVGSNTSLAEFDKISEYPTTEISVKVASGIRMALNQFISSNSPFYSTDNIWKAYFWNRGLEIEKCY